MVPPLYEDKSLADFLEWIPVDLRRGHCFVAHKCFRKRCPDILEFHILLSGHFPVFLALIDLPVSSNRVSEYVKVSSGTFFFFFSNLRC